MPTWNYAVVHVYGRPKIIDDHERIVSLLEETVSRYESGYEKPWTGDLPLEYRDKLVQGIVAFEIPLSRVEGKFKLGQNRSAADLQGVFDALSASEDQESRALACMMAEECSITRQS